VKAAPQPVVMARPQRSRWFWLPWLLWALFMLLGFMLGLLLCWVCRRRVVKMVGGAPAQNRPAPVPSQKADPEAAQLVQDTYPSRVPSYGTAAPPVVVVETPPPSVVEAPAPVPVAAVEMTTQTMEDEPIDEPPVAEEPVARDVAVGNDGDSFVSFVRRNSSRYEAPPPPAPPAGVRSARFEAPPPPLPPPSAMDSLQRPVSSMSTGNSSLTESDFTSSSLPSIPPPREPGGMRDRGAGPDAQPPAQPKADSKPACPPCLPRGKKPPPSTAGYSDL
jgi:hypothetical protein